MWNRNRYITTVLVRGAPLYSANKHSSDSGLNSSDANTSAVSLMSVLPYCSWTVPELLINCSLFDAKECSLLQIIFRVFFFMKWQELGVIIWKLSESICYQWIANIILNMLTRLLTIFQHGSVELFGDKARQRCIQIFDLGLQRSVV